MLYRFQDEETGKITEVDFPIDIPQGKPQRNKSIAHAFT